jgi:hypothetical protein
MNQTKSVAIYARVSTDKQKVEMQLAELREYVQRAGWKVYREFVDEGYSGKNIIRPAFKQMMDEAGRHKFELVLVWKLDRLSRSLKDFDFNLQIPANMLYFVALMSIAMRGSPPSVHIKPDRSCATIPDILSVLDKIKYWVLYHLAIVGILTVSIFSLIISMY